MQVQRAQVSALAQPLLETVSDFMTQALQGGPSAGTAFSHTALSAMI